MGKGGQNYGRSENDAVSKTTKAVAEDVDIQGRAHQLFDNVCKKNSAPPILSNFKTSVSVPLQSLNLVDPFEYFIRNDTLYAWTSKISSLVREKRPQKAIGVFKKMLSDEQCPNVQIFLRVAEAAALLDSQYLVCGLHGCSIKIGFLELQASVVTSLVGLYSSWDMESAWRMYDEAPNKDVILCTAMVSACVGSMQHVGALKVLKEMLHLGLQPNHVTIATILPACADLSALRFGKEIHCHSIRRSLSGHTLILNSLLNFYSKCSRLEAALHVYRHMQHMDIVSWRIIIHGCVINKSPLKALEIFHEMRASTVEEVDEYIVLDIIGAYSQLDKNYVQGFHSLVWKMGITVFVSVATELLQVYAKFGDTMTARDIFDQLKWKDVIVWTVMITAYVQNDKPTDAFDMFRQMQITEKKPNQYTFVSLLLSCTSADALETGMSIHTMITKYGYSTNTYLTSALIDMYCNFGRTRQGKAVFDEYPSKDLICWSSMINGYAINGCGGESLECFSHMLSHDVEPNDAIFVSVLSVCSHCRLDYEGWNWFHAMEPVYGVKPKLAHYACMVDMLSRQGNVEEALEFVNNMPVEPDKRIWGALLAGCRSTRVPTEVLELVAKKLISMDSENASYYVLLSNLYADQGKWKEVEELRNMMDTKSLKKVMGYSTS